MTRLRVTTASVILFVVLLGAGLVARNIVSRSDRVLGWFAAGAIVAALLHPLVHALAKPLPRGIAVAVVVVGALAAVGGLVYATVGDLSREVSKLQDAAPDAARRIEASRRFGRTARDFGLTKRVTDFVNDLPKHISGSAASVTARGIAYVAGIVLTIFLLLYGGRLVDGLLRQIRDDTRRANAARVLEDGYRRWWRYVVLTLGRAAVAGLFGYVVCRVAGLPGAVVLSLVVGIFALIPYLGVLVGSVPIVLLAVGVNPSVPPVLELLAVFITYQLLEAFLVQPRLESASIRVGPAVTFLVAIVAFDLYGIGGALYGVAAATFVVAVLDELAPTDADTVDLSELDRPVSP